jgi:hypothetical protein
MVVARLRAERGDEKPPDTTAAIEAIGANNGARLRGATGARSAPLRSSRIEHRTSTVRFPSRGAWTRGFGAGAGSGVAAVLLGIAACGT